MQGLAVTREAETSPAAKALVHAGFVLTGVVTTLLGPILPVFTARWSLSDTQAGYLFTAQFTGSMLGVALSSLLVPRRGFRWSLAAGFTLMALGIGVVGLGAWVIGLLSVFCYGLGQGVTIPVTNLLVSDWNPERRAAALNTLNFAWGIGAVGCPFLVSGAQRTGNLVGWLLGLAIALALIAASIAFVPAAYEPSRTCPPEERATIGRSVWRDRFAPALGALFFLYVGTETALGGWVASYAKRVSASPGTVWVLAPSFFWGSLLLGRALAPAVLRRIAQTRLVLLGLIIAGCGVIILLDATSETVVLMGASLAGFGLATVFPITVALLSYFGGLAPRAAGPMFALGGLGGAILPWLVGLWSSRFGSLKTGLTIPLLAILIMLMLHGWNARREIGGIAP